MLIYIASFILIGLGLAAVALQRLYSVVPVRELKRLASEGDGLAKALYGPAAYGRALRAFLWTFGAVSLAAGVVLLSVSAPTLIAMVAVMMILFLSLVWLPSIELGIMTARLAVLGAAPVRWTLSHTFRFWEKIATLANKRRALPAPHTKLYDKDDLQALLARQQAQHDNRISQNELDQVHHVLNFHEKKAADLTTPRKDVRLLASTEAIGPVLLGELHESGQQSFFVYEGTPENIVGVLQLKDAVAAREGGLIGQLVHRDLCYVHEDFSLHHALKALRATRQQIAVVVNSFEEFVGTLSLDHLMRQLLGEYPDHESGMDYESRARVGAFRVQAAPVAEVSDESPEVAE